MDTLYNKIKNCKLRTNSKKSNHIKKEKTILCVKGSVYASVRFPYFDQNRNFDHLCFSTALLRPLQFENFVRKIKSASFDRFFLLFFRILRRQKPTNNQKYF